MATQARDWRTMMAEHARLLTALAGLGTPDDVDDEVIATTRAAYTANQ
jgi:hypothetical protein